MDLVDFTIALSILCTLIISLVLSVEYRLLDRFDVVREVRHKLNILFKAVDYWVESRRSQPQVNVVRNDSGRSMSITYTQGGRSAILNIPFDKERSSKMRMWKLCLIPHVGDPIPITQEPGTPYLCSAKMLGGEEIIAKHNILDQTIRFQSEVIPMWLD